MLELESGPTVVVQEDSRQKEGVPPLKLVVEEVAFPPDFERKVARPQLTASRP